MASSSYDEIASEYYDAGHVTSRNFDATTAHAVRELNVQFKRGKILDLGAGRGRVCEYFKVKPDRVVQLDNSQRMFEIPGREDCLLKVVADACEIPLADGQFDAVIGLLADPFFGLDSMGEAFRMLDTGGQLFLTLPTLKWAEKLRGGLAIDLMSTRFKKLGTEERVVLPSIVHSEAMVREILSYTGFTDIEICSHPVPRSVEVVSRDIEGPASMLGVDKYALEVIHTVRATK